MGANRQSNFVPCGVNVRRNQNRVDCSDRHMAHVQQYCSPTAASSESESAVQRLSWCAVIRQNFGNRRRKVIDAGTRHDDAVAAPVGLLRDAQESPAVVFAELHIEMLALDLQFFRLDDVIHFA
jgi:hypothetical protein